MQDSTPENAVFKLLDYWQICSRFRWMIVGTVVSSVLVTGIVCKLSPKLYEAKATTMPIKEETLSGGGISIGGGKDSKSGGGGGTLDIFGGKSGPNVMDTMLVLLNSRVMAEAVVEKLNLVEYYDARSKLDAANMLLGEKTGKAGPAKNIEITVLTKDPQMAAAIANAYITELDVVYKNYNVSGVKRNRIFIEARLAEKTKALDEAEETMKAFQERHRFLSVTSEGAGASYGIAADLHGQIVALEMELASLKEFTLPSHPKINSLNVQIRELRRQLDKLEKDQLQGFVKSMKTAPPLSAKLFPTFEEAPTLGLDFLRLSRRIKVEESVYGMLVGMLESAKLAEVRDLPVVPVLDSALPPLHRSKPQPLKNMMVASVVSLLVAIMLAIFLNNILEQLKLHELQSRFKEGAKGDIDPASPSGNGHRVGATPAPSKEIEVGHHVE